MKKLLLKNSIARSAIGLALLFSTTLCPISRADDSHKLVVGKPNTPCPNALYSTIAAAVSAASPGDEIDICPALYPEQLIINKPLKLVGATENGVDRILLQPTLTSLAGLPSEAVITVMNTHDVTIRNLAIDASNNSIAGCATNTNGVITGSLAGIHFYNASGSVEHSAIFGAQLPPPGCAKLFPGNGFAVEVDTDGASAGPFQVSIEHNSLHDFGRNGVLAVGAAVRVDVDGNSISGVGPSTGANQFGVFLALGTVGRVSGNFISQGLCGAIPAATCDNLRSEGVVLRSAGDNTVVEGNIITNVQYGFFLNGANKATIRNNVINNVSVGSGMQLQGITNSLIVGNRISSILPIDNDVVTLEEGCGINELSLLQGAPPGSPANAGNTFRDNTINDAYCGIAHVTASTVESGTYFNTLYTTLNTDQIGMTPFPGPTEP